MSKFSPHHHRHTQTSKVNTIYKRNALVVLLLSCHPKTELLLFGQYCNSTSLWMLYVTENRTSIIVILLNQALTFAEKKTDSVLFYLYFSYKNMCEDNGSKCQNIILFKNSTVLTHGVQLWIICWVTEETWSNTPKACLRAISGVNSRVPAWHT